ncbi:3-oxoacyl-ACP reductase [Rubrivirga sp. S365]|uniref:3-oxoacyl-ACP reductase n=1 Tax=Rubrivirga litoralis TaxID=3075598 RepID=A0ABU3BME9_9BACT|nr:MULTISPECIES: 3-oxoacyl-ACP reductase [unclassified Rubrivirga]MDT0630458.1 3-oxoacyl-ACP reductase [Rubrivirga sp. F394]MDT7857564.1 3-oxoacyl-ACP reductase [Rubrivirga sp. S365]
MPALPSDTVALVTGASRGAGRAIARALAREGAAVAVNYLQSQDKAQAVVEEIESAGGRAFAHQADVTDADAVQALVDAVVERWGRLDVVVSSALPRYSFDPSAPYVSVETVEWDHFQRQYEGAVRAAFHLARAALPTMKAQGGGSLVHVGTNLVYNPVVTYHDYTAAKAGLVGLTRTLAKELGAYGVRVNLVAGGLLQTTDASAVTTDEVFEFVRQGTPLQETVTPEQFADAVLFFASPWSRSVTGQSLAVDGGLTMA